MLHWILDIREMSVPHESSDKYKYNYNLPLTNTSLFSLMIDSTSCLQDTNYSRSWAYSTWIKSESKLRSLAATYLSKGWCWEQKTCSQRPLQRPGAHEGFHQYITNLNYFLPKLYWLSLQHSQQGSLTTSPHTCTSYIIDKIMMCIILYQVCVSTDYRGAQWT